MENGAVEWIYIDVSVPHEYNKFLESTMRSMTSSITIRLEVLLTGQQTRMQSTILAIKFAGYARRRGRVDRGFQTTVEAHMEGCAATTRHAQILPWKNRHAQRPIKLDLEIAATLLYSPAYIYMRKRLWYMSPGDHHHLAWTRKGSLNLQQG